MSSSWKSRDEEPEDEENEDVVDNEVRSNNCRAFYFVPPTTRFCRRIPQERAREKKETD